MPTVNLGQISAIKVGATPPSVTTMWWYDTGSNLLKYFDVGTSTWVAGASNAFNGDRVVKRSGIPNVNAGGTTIQAFLEAYFFPFIGATININGNLLYEVGDTVDVTVSGATIANDETLFENGVVTRFDPTEAVLGSFGSALSYSFVDTVLAGDLTFIGGTDVAYRRTYKASQEVGNNGASGEIESGIKSVEFVYPYLFGMNASLLDGSSIYSSLTKSIEKYGASKGKTYNNSSMRMYFAFPSEYPDLVSIKDQNGFEVLGSFTKVTIDVVSSGIDVVWTKSYKIYYTNLTTVNNGVFTFRHV